MIEPQPPTKRPRGRPALPPGSSKASRIELRTTPGLAAKAQLLADAAGVSRNAWIEGLIARAEG